MATPPLFEPPCGAKTRDGWTCGRPAERTHVGYWRCKRHSRPDDPDITPTQRVRYDANERLRQAREGVRASKERVARLGNAESAARAAFGDVWLEETSDKLTRSATVTYSDGAWEARTIRAKVYVGAGLSAPRLEVTPGVPNDWSGGYAKAQAAIWAWIAEVLTKAMREYREAVLTSIDEEVLKLAEAESRVPPAEERVELTKAL